MQMKLISLIWVLLSINVQSQWVPSTTIPDQILSLSPDGSTAIGRTGIYIKAGTEWSLAQLIPPSYKLNYPSYSQLYSVALFLSEDGSKFAISNLSACGVYVDSSIDIYDASLDKMSWNISSSIYGSSLGLDGYQCLFPTTATTDGNTLIVISSDLYYSSDMFALIRNGSEYVFKQQFLGPTTSYPIGKESLTADGSFLSIFEGSYEYGLSPVQIFSRQSDGSYLYTENYGFVAMYSMALSSDGQLMVGAVCTNKSSGYQAHFFKRTIGRYQLMSVVDIGDGACAYDEVPSFSYFAQLPISSDASIIFITVPNANTTYIFKQVNQTSWAQIQSLSLSLSSLSYPPSYTICSSNGSTLLTTTAVNNSFVTLAFQSN